MKLRDYIYLTLETRNTYKGRELVSNDNRELDRFEIQVCIKAYKIFKNSLENLPNYKERLLINRDRTLIIFGDYIRLKSALNVDAQLIGEDASAYIIEATHAVIDDRINNIEKQIKKEENAKKRLEERKNDDVSYLRFYRYDTYGGCTTKEINDAINEYMNNGRW